MGDGCADRLWGLGLAVARPSYSFGSGWQPNRVPARYGVGGSVRMRLTHSGVIISAVVLPHELST